MNKKKYISPSVETFVFVSSSMLASSQGNGIIIGGGDEKVDSDADQLSAGRRGSWGNLWK